MASSYYKMKDSRESELSLNKVSRWVSTIAVPILLLLVAGLVVLSLLLKYPKTVNISINIIPEQSSLRIIYDGDSKAINNIFFETNDSLGKGAIVGTKLIGPLKTLDSIYSPFAGRLIVNYDFQSAKTQLIIVANNNVFTVRGLIAADKVGFIQKGSEIDIWIDESPVDNGAIKGIVSNISGSSTTGFYSLDITLPQGMITTKGIKVPVISNVKAHAKILTENENLLRKILNSMRQKTSQN
jgi:hypothetical protein